MIKYIDTKDLFRTKQFVRETVDNLARILHDSPSKKVILNGGRGTGKSTILQNMENKGIKSENPTILTQFDSITTFSVMPNNIFNKAFFEHYYELCFSWKLLNFIKKNYNTIYEKYFNDIELLLRSLTEEMNKNIRRACYDGLTLKRYLYSTEISSEILERLKNHLNTSDFILAIDRFDWTNGRSQVSQEILSRYFDMFAKTIITSDDEELNDTDKRKELEEKGYSFVTTVYGKDVEVVKNIIRKRIELYNESSNYYFDIDSVTDQIYTDLISKTDGNISSMIRSASEVTDLWKWYGGDADIYELFQRATREQLENEKQLRISQRPPKFYL